MEISLDQLWQMEMDQLGLEQGTVPDPDIWRWSPLDIKEFDIMLCIAKGLAIREAEAHGEAFRQLSIAEAGSGIGTKLYLAKHKYDLTEVGYEINDDYLAKSHALGVHAEKRDLADKDNPPIWAAFDIVYIARPFKNDFLEAEWEKEVQADMAPGAVLISAFAAVKPYTWPCYYRRPFRGVWIKPVEGRAYTPSVAQIMKTAVPLPKRNTHFTHPG